MLFGMSAEHVIRLIDLYARHNRLAPRTVTTYAALSGGFYDRLLNGNEVTVGRLNRTVAWLSSHWPDDLPWPPDIPRPAPQRQAA